MQGEMRGLCRLAQWIETAGMLARFGGRAVAAAQLINVSNPRPLFVVPAGGSGIVCGVTNDVVGWCMRCGNNQPADRLCRACWEGRADVQTARDLAERALTGDRDAAAVIGVIADSRAADALADLAYRASGRLKTDAIKSLGWSGSPRDVPVLAAALDDADVKVRAAARGALADIGGDAAADALAAALSAVEDDAERAGVVEALAWLRDQRALPDARRYVELWSTPEGLRLLLSSGSLTRSSASWILLRLLDGAEREAVIAEALACVPDADFRRYPGLTETAQLAAARIAEAHRMLQESDPLEAEAFREQVAELAGDEIGRFANSVRPVRLRRCDDDLDPLGERVVPKLGIAGLSTTPPAAGPSPPAKFGGQPDWISEPQWPVSVDGKPLTFHAQLPVPGHEGQMAYIFFASAADDDSWEPLSSGNAVVVQPAGTCHLPTVPLRHGPGIWRIVEEPGHYSRLWGIRERYERYAVLEEGLDPLVFDYPRYDLEAPRLPFGSEDPCDMTDGNKIGGTPTWLQGDEVPDGDGWRFAFQWSAGWASEELADGAEIYGFIRDSDLAACVLWQCH